MKKVELLLNELTFIRKTNLIKLIVTLMIILVIGIGIFLVGVGSMQFKIIISIILVLVMTVIYLLNYKKQTAIAFFKANYLKKPDEVLRLLENRKKHYLDMFDYTNETLLFNEIERALRIYRKYQDKSQIGPWEIIYNERKTHNYYENLVIKNTPSILKLVPYLDNLPIEVKNLLRDLGIDYHKVYSTWDKKFGNHPNEYELMYPIFGLILNDSQVLRHGMINKEYQINETTYLKPYETKVDEDEVIMLHIKVHFN